MRWWLWDPQSPGCNDDSRWRQMSYTRDFLFKPLVFPWAISSCFLIMKPLTTLLWSHSHLSLVDEATQPSILLHYYEAPCTFMEPPIYIRSLLTDKLPDDEATPLNIDIDMMYLVVWCQILMKPLFLGWSYIWVKTKPFYIDEATCCFMKPPWTQGSSVRVASAWEPGY